MLTVWKFISLISDHGRFLNEIPKYFVVQFLIQAFKEPYIITNTSKINFNLGATIQIPINILIKYTIFICYIFRSSWINRPSNQILDHLVNSSVHLMSFFAGGLHNSVENYKTQFKLFLSIFKPKWVLTLYFCCAIYIL